MPESAVAAMMPEISTSTSKPAEFMAFPEPTLAEFAMPEPMMVTAIAEAALVESAMAEAPEERSAPDSAVMPSAEFEASA